MPDNDILERCANRNHDGYGFATPDGVCKTLDYSSFRYALGKVDKNTPCVIHMRLATHGSVKRENCHPFYDAETGISFAHNGILPITPAKDMTDSETAFRRYYLPIIREDGGIHSRDLAEEVMSTIGSSKFAFMDKDGYIRKFGKWFELKGCFYSNYYF